MVLCYEESSVLRQCYGTGHPWESGHMEHNGYNGDAMDTGHTRVTSIETHVIILVHHV